MKLKKISAKKIEGLGLLLILGSFLWQTIEERLVEISSNVDNYEIHEKLDSLFGLTSEMYSNSEWYEEYASASVDFGNAIKKWKHWNAIQRDRKSLDNQLKFFFWFRVFLYSMGSLLIIVPKFK